jgi:hypothetical protein
MLEYNLLIPAVFGLILLVASIVAVARVWRRGPVWISCPEGGRPAMVTLGQERIEVCSLWPDRVGCAERCLAELASGRPRPPIIEIVERWHESNSCALCGRRLLKSFRWWSNPVLLARDGTTEEWNKVENLPAALAAGESVCWGCHIAESYGRGHGASGS